MRKNRTAFVLILAGSLALLLAGCSLFNDPPVPALVRSPSSGDAPLSVFFDASDSIDPDGIIVSYAWTFGDGSGGTGPTATHTYTVPGLYETTVTVTDDHGVRSVLSRMIDVRSAQNPPETGTEVGQAAPDFTLETLDGDPVTLSDLRGYVVLLDFWASWCPPCRMTMPHLEMLRVRFEGEGLVVVALNLDPVEADARDYIEENGYTGFTVLRGSLVEAQAVRELYEVEGIPHTFVIDRQGIIRHADHPIRLRDYHIEGWL